MSSCDITSSGACDAHLRVVHLGYNHDFSRMGDAAQTDRAAIDAFGDALTGTGLVADLDAGHYFGRV